MNRRNFLTNTIASLCVAILPTRLLAKSKEDKLLKRLETVDESSTDINGYKTIKRSGIIESNESSDWDLFHSVVEYNRMAIPKGFYRKVVRCELSENGKTLYWQIVLQQVCKTAM